MRSALGQLVRSHIRLLTVGALAAGFIATPTVASALGGTLIWNPNGDRPVKQLPGLPQLPLTHAGIATTGPASKATGALKNDLNILLDAQAMPVQVVNDQRENIYQWPSVPSNACGLSAYVCYVKQGIQPINANVDGTALPWPQIISSAISAAESSAVSRHQSMAVADGLRAGVAYATLQQLMYEQAQADGRVLSTDEATAYAQKQLDAYNAAAADKQPMLPAGMTPEQMFRDPKRVAVFQVTLSIAREKQALFGSLDPDKASAAEVAWFRSALTNHVVTVEGIAQFSLPDALPPGTS